MSKVIPRLYLRSGIPAVCICWHHLAHVVFQAVSLYLFPLHDFMEVTIWNVKGDTAFVFTFRNTGCLHLLASPCSRSFPSSEFVPLPSARLHGSHDMECQR